jgi:hypothetical protein
MAFQADQLCNENQIEHLGVPSNEIDSWQLG